MGDSLVALKASEVDRFLAKPDPACPIVLVYGPDAGLVHERAAALISGAVNDVNDPFSLVRLDGDELSGNPLRLVEEANTIPLFGGRRAIWLRVGARNILPAVEALIGAPRPECSVVIEAGDLRRNAPLRTLCERAKHAIALPCYPDAADSLARLVDQEMAQAKLAISPDARAALIPFLGGDRQASRSELRKLALYAHGRDTVTLDDVLAVVADASALALDGVVDATFAGRLPDLEQLYAKASAAGTAPGSIVSAALRQAGQLHKLKLAAESGGGVNAAIDSIRPPIHFLRKTMIKAAITGWTAERLLEAMAQLNAAVLQTRRNADLADAIARRALLSVAMAGRRKK